MAILRSLLVTMGLNSSNYRTEVNRTARETKKQFSVMRVASEQWGKITVAAMASAAVAMTKANAQMVRDQSNMARVANMTIQEYKAMSFAATQYGVDAEQIADVSKDAIEKLGEYLNTGGGGIQDFADAMNMSKEETMAWVNAVEGMSGQQIFQKMVNDMESAGLTAGQMSHALEGMGSDVTKLIPLFSNNGAELSRLTEKYNDFNRELSPEQVRGYLAAAENVDLLAASFQALSQVALSGLGEFIGDMAEDIRDFTAQIDAFHSRVEALGVTSVTIDVMTGTGWREQHRELFKEFTEIKEELKKYEDVSYEDLPAINPFGLSKNEWSNLQRDYGIKKAELEALNNAIVDEQKRAAELLKKPETPELPKKGPRKQTKYETEIESDWFVKSFGEQSVIDSQTVALEIQKQQEAESLAERLRMNQESLEEKYTRESEILKNNLTDYEVYRQAKKDLDAEYDKAQREAAEKQAQYQQQTAQDLLSFTAQSMSITTDMLSQAGEEHSGIYKALFMAQKMAAIPSMVVATQEAYTKALAAFPTSPWIAEGVRAMGYTSIGIATGQAVAGVFHDGGAIPEDGTYLMQGGEYVESRAERRQIEDMLEGGKGTTIQQNITVTGTGDQDLIKAMTQAAEAGARQGYDMVYKDVRGNGNIYKQVRR